MKTLIAYATNHGCTQKAALELKDLFGGKTQLVNLKETPKPDIKDFDRIIIGGSIHAGRIQRNVKQFCENNFKEFKDKEIGLFICCMEKGEKASIQFNDAFPKLLRQHAKASACLGGEFNFEKMSVFQRMIVKKVATVEQSTSNIDHEAIVTFSKKMDKVFNPFLFLA